MKKVLFVCLMAVLGLGITNAPAKDAKKELVTTVFQTDIHCDHCAERVMANIPFEKGVKDVQVDLPTKRITVVYDGSKNDVEGLVKGFAKIRVKAETCNEGCTGGCGKKGDCNGQECKGTCNPSCDASCGQTCNGSCNHEAGCPKAAEKKACCQQQGNCPAKRK